jgi:hypothetical protein
MGNRIKLDGTTSSTFQIGKTGLTIDGEVGAQNTVLVVNDQGVASAIDIGLESTPGESGTDMLLSDIDENGCGYAGTVTTDQSGSIGIGFSTNQDGEDFFNQTPIGSTFILDDHLSGRYGEGNDSARWAITVTNIYTVYSPEDYTYIQVDFDTAVYLGPSQPIDSYNYVVYGEQSDIYAISKFDGDIANVKIQGGTSGQVLSTDGSGNLTWVDQGGTPPEPTVSIVTDTFTGDDETTVFPLTATFDNSSDCIVFVDGLLQFEFNTYYISGTNIEFFAAPGSGQTIVAKTITNSDWTLNEFSTNDGEPISFTLSVEPVGDVVVVVNDTYFDSSNYTVTGSTFEIIDNYPTYSSVKVYIGPYTTAPVQSLIGNTSENVTSLGINQGPGATAFDSVVIGDGAGANIDGSTSVVIIGQNAGQGIISEGSIIAIGQGAASGGGPIGAFNTIIGLNAGTNMTGLMNFALGTDSAQNVSGWYNIGIGTEALGYSSDNEGYYNIGLGRDAGKGIVGANSICIGSYAGTNTKDESPFTLGDNMIVIGVNAMPANDAESNKTYIGNDATEDTYLRGNVHSSGSVNGVDGTFSGNLVANFMQIGVSDAETLNTITGTVGQFIAVSDTGGRLAYWDDTNARWSYVFDNSAVYIPE